MAFVWSFSNGVLFVGFIAMFIAGNFTFVYSGLLGGSLWATGNLCVIPIVKAIGLGPGMLLWGATSLLTGFLTGKFGLFGLQKQAVPHDAVNWISIAFVVASMIVFFFVKPSVDKRTDYEQLDEEKFSKGKSVQAEEAETSIIDRVPPKFRRMLGVILAIASGMLYGVNMVPMMLWTQKYKHEHDCKPPGTLDFVFSHFTGIYLYSTTIFIIYCMVNRNKPKIFPASVLPSMISGAMWGVAQCGLMSATSILGYTVGFPIGSAGPIIVSSLWSVVYFREILGMRNLLILGTSFLLLFIGIILLALSNDANISFGDKHLPKPANTTGC